jgi:hypothetical protein
MSLALDQELAFRSIDYEPSFDHVSLALNAECMYELSS